MPDVSVSTINSSSKIPSQQEKYHKVYSIAQKLAYIASDISSREFGYAVECLKQIVAAWEQGKYVVVEVVHDDANDCADEGKVFMEDTENLINSNINNATVEVITEEDDAYSDHYDADENEVFQADTDNIFNDNPFVDHVNNNPVDDDFLLRLQMKGIV